MRPALARYGAPVAFLVAATVAILLVRSSLADDRPTARARPAATAPQTTRTQVAARTNAPRTQTVAAEHYVIRAGDTLATVADRYDTSVAALVGLNPGIDPTGLQVGQRIRVK